VLELEVRFRETQIYSSFLLTSDLAQVVVRQVAG